MNFGQPLRESIATDADSFATQVLSAGEPVVLRDVAQHWPAVQAARRGDIGAYLKRLDRGARWYLLVGDPAIGGRFFYDEGMRGFNFARRDATISAVVDQLTAVTAAAARGEPVPSLAAQATQAADAVPQFAVENPAPFPGIGAAPRLWLNNVVTVAAHNDASRNLAVVVAGRRRFTVFAPEDGELLYPGPIEFSPAGRPISLVDFARPDLDRYPRFREAMARARFAELEPGDAIYLPYMWWHHVQSLAPINLLANYWWNEVAAPLPGLDLFDLIVHARIAFSAASPEQRHAWRAMLGQALAEGALPQEIPADRRGILGGIGDAARRALRARLAAMLSQ